jgi:hypothetical protein
MVLFVSAKPSAAVRRAPVSDEKSIKHKLLEYGPVPAVAKPHVVLFVATSGVPVAVADEVV